MHAFDTLSRSERSNAYHLGHTTDPDELQRRIVIRWKEDRWHGAVTVPMSVMLFWVIPIFYGVSKQLEDTVMVSVMIGGFLIFYTVMMYLMRLQRVSLVLAAAYHISLHRVRQGTQPTWHEVIIMSKRFERDN